MENLRTSFLHTWQTVGRLYVWTAKVCGISNLFIKRSSSGGRPVFPFQVALLSFIAEWWKLLKLFEVKLSPDDALSCSETLRGSNDTDPFTEFLSLEQLFGILKAQRLWKFPPQPKIVAILTFTPTFTM